MLRTRCQHRVHLPKALSVLCHSQMNPSRLLEKQQIPENWDEPLHFCIKSSGILSPSHGISFPSPHSPDFFPFLSPGAFSDSQFRWFRLPLQFAAKILFSPSSLNKKKFTEGFPRDNFSPNCGTTKQSNS